jgi:hypothetical protein
MKKKDTWTIIDEMAQINPEALTADGYDDCIIGIGERCGQSDIFVYDSDKIINKLVKRDGMDYEEALEFYSYNIAGAWMGEGTPIFVRMKTKDFVRPRTLMEIFDDEV